MARCCPDLDAAASFLHLSNLPLQLGPGQSRGRHGFHRPHDPAHLTHSASRSRPDPVHHGLPFNVGRAPAPALPPEKRARLELPFTTETTVTRRHGDPALESSCRFASPRMFQVLCGTRDTGSQSRAPAPSHLSRSVFITLHTPEKAVKGTHVP